MNRLIELYKKTDGGHRQLSEGEFVEYAALRKKEYQDRKAELITAGKKNIRASKDENGDVIGWTYTN